MSSRRRWRSVKARSESAAAETDRLDSDEDRVHPGEPSVQSRQRECPGFEGLGLGWQAP